MSSYSYCSLADRTRLKINVIIFTSIKISILSHFGIVCLHDTSKWIKKNMSRGIFNFQTSLHDMHYSVLKEMFPSLIGQKDWYKFDHAYNITPYFTHNCVLCNWLWLGSVVTIANIEECIIKFTHFITWVSNMAKLGWCAFRSSVKCWMFWMFLFHCKVGICFNSIMQKFLILINSCTADIRDLFY